MKYIAIQPLAGGFALGATQAIGHKPEIIISNPAYDFNNSFLYKYWNDDPAHVTFNEYLKNPIRDIDIVISVPVCAGLSQLNSSKSRGSNAPQNENMLFNTEFALKEIKPKVFMFENAPALYTKVGQGVVDKLKIIAKKYGYSITLYKTNTLYHGIPQNRKRTFAIFWRGSRCPIMEYENKRISLSEYLNQIPKDATLQDVFVNENITDDILYQFLEDKLGNNFKKTYFEYNANSLMGLLIKLALIDEFIDYCKEHNHEKYCKIASHVKNKLELGKNYWDNSLCFANEKCVGAIQGRMYGRIIHPTENRDFSVRELIHLMGHPHDYQIDDIKNLNIIAQNVPVATSKFITTQVMKFIQGDLEMTNLNFTKQENKGQVQDNSSISSFF